MTRWRLLALTLLLAMIAGLVWWSQRPLSDPMEAIGPEAAYIVCEGVPLEEQLLPRNPWRAHLPGPGSEQSLGSVPAALFTNDMAPYDLRELGFADGGFACAAWLGPRAEAVEAMRAPVEAVGAAMDELEALGRGCGCTSARSAGLLPWVPGCGVVRERKGCLPDGAVEMKMQETVDRVREAMASGAMPRRHWRLAGPVGRTGRFAALHDDIAGHLGVSAQSYTPQLHRPPTGTDPLVAALLDAEGVQVVMRDPQRRWVTVVRELRGLLIFDHFELSAEPRRWGTHYAAFDEAAAPLVLAALALPKERSGPRPTKPTVIYDQGMLAQHDAQAVVARRLEGAAYDLEAEMHELEPPLFWRLRFEAVPGGLDLYAALTEAGEAFVSAGAGAALNDRAATMVEQIPSYVFEPAPGKPRYALRGTELEQGWFDGPRHIGALVQALAFQDVTWVQGTLEAFVMKLPMGPLPAELETLPGLQRMRTEVSTERHDLSVERQGGILEAKLRRRTGTATAPD